MPKIAKSYEITDREIRVDGELFPYYVHEDGPRIEPAFDGELTTLWLPIIVDQRCPKLGAPESSRTVQIEEIEAPSGESWSIEPHEHDPVQHRDGKPPWCNTCKRTADGRCAQCMLPLRETAGLICENCGTDYGSNR